jgi:hypothetical protein
MSLCSLAYTVSYLVCVNRTKHELPRAVFSDIFDYRIFLDMEITGGNPHKEELWVFERAY